MGILFQTGHSATVTLKVVLVNSRVKLLEISRNLWFIQLFLEQLKIQL